MNTMNDQDSLTSQWIRSLAIAVVCCAVLFLVFARYIMELHDATALVTVRLEVLQERQNQLIAELDAMRRPIPVQIRGDTTPHQQQQPTPAVQQPPTEAPASITQAPAVPSPAPTPPAGNP